MIKKLFFNKLTAILITIVISLPFFTTQKAHAESKIYFFYGIGCPHCSIVESFFEKENIYDKYPIEQREIYFERENALLYTQIMDRMNVPKNQRVIPMVIIGDEIIVGDDPIIQRFEETADAFLNRQESPNKIIVQEKETKNTSIDLTLPAVIAASIVDAINPCAFAVLIILMSTVLVSKSPEKALKAGFGFATSIFISYFLMGLGLYKALELGGVSSVFFKVIGWLAIVLGLFNLKDYFWYGKGFLMEVPMSWRPKLKSLINSITSPLGAFGIGFVISLFLLPCTSGPYIVILGMLANKVLQTKAVLYLIIYNLIFVSPMFLITLAVYKGFDPSRAEEERQKRLRVLHLIAGIIMLVMGAVIINGWI